ncbi:hypothetical protein U1Q18_014652 [Sarracenia purpurea var. burkii]
MTRSVTSDLSRKEPLTSSENWRRSRLPKNDEGLKLVFWGTERTLTLRYLRSAILAAATMFVEAEAEAEALFGPREPVVGALEFRRRV